MSDRRHDDRVALLQQIDAALARALGEDEEPIHGSDGDGFAREASEPVLPPPSLQREVPATRPELQTSRAPAEQPGTDDRPVPGQPAPGREDAGGARTVRAGTESGQIRPVRLSELLSAGVALQWHEAVAVVQELAVTAGSTGAVVPELDAAEIQPDGRVTLSTRVAAARYGRPLAAQSGVPDENVARLARTLQALLEGVTAPPELRLLISQDTFETPAHATIEEFSSALTFFERPDRRRIVAAVAARVAQEPAEPSRPRPVPPPAAPWSGPAEEKPEISDAALAWRRRLRKLPPAAAGVLGLCGLAYGVWIVWPVQTESASALAADETVTSQARGALQSLVRSSLAAVGVTVGEEAPPEEAAQPPDQAAGRRAARAPARDARPRTEPPPPALMSAGLPAAVLVAPPAAGEPAAPPAAGSQALEASAVNAGGQVRQYREVYSEGDPYVRPAVLIRPQLPTVPTDRMALDGGAAGTLDIIVGESGHVEQVRLISPANRYHERMIVSAAKAWLFEPARLDGRPVRYRTQITITY